MKKILLLLSICLILISTGCFKRDSMEDISIYTSVYPIEYIVNKLYGKHAEINSIYPDGIIVDKYTLTDKQLENYGKSDLFIFNGLSIEKNYIKPMFKSNRNLKIIDSSASIEYTNRMEEIWLDPSNFLMIAQNIRTGFEEYIKNQYLINEIETNYEQLKIDVSSLDAKIQTMIAKAPDKTILVSSNLFKYLEKYNLEIISLDTTGTLLEKNMVKAKELISSGKIKYIYTIKNETLNEEITNFIEETKIETLEFHNLANLNETEHKEKKDYLSIMSENVELLKQELYE